MPQVRVVSLAGETLCDLVLDRSEALRGVALQAAAALGGVRCRLIGPAGEELQTATTVEGAGLPDPAILTAVACKSLVVYASKFGGAFAASTWQGRIITWGQAYRGGAGVRDLARPGLGPSEALRGGAAAALGGVRCRLSSALRPRSWRRQPSWREPDCRTPPS